MERDVTRRELVAAGGALALLAFAPPARVQALIAETARSGVGRFLSGAELATLRAVCDRLVPGPPRDPGPGAVEARAPEAIDLLLGAFSVRPPLIHAGGPFSGRAGGGRDNFAQFEPMDRHAELGWRIRLEGPRNRRERAFAGGVVGLQEVYRTGVARLDVLARHGGAASFAAADGALQDSLLAAKHEPLVSRLTGVAMGQALDATFGPPEYGGNLNLVGWRRLGWAGDTQPRGWDPSAVTHADPGTSAVPASAAADIGRRLAPHIGGRRASLETWWAGYRGLGR